MTRTLSRADWFGVVDEMRKLLLIGVATVVAPGSYIQIGFGILVAMLSLELGAALRPYKAVKVFALDCYSRDAHSIRPFLLAELRRLISSPTSATWP